MPIGPGGLGGLQERIQAAMQDGTFQRIVEQAQDPQQREQMAEQLAQRDDIEPPDVDAPEFQQALGFSAPQQGQPPSVGIPQMPQAPGQFMQAQQPQGNPFQQQQPAAGDIPQEVQQRYVQLMQEFAPGRGDNKEGQARARPEVEQLRQQYPGIRALDTQVGLDKPAGTSNFVVNDGQLQRNQSPGLGRAQRAQVPEDQLTQAQLGRAPMGPNQQYAQTVGQNVAPPAMFGQAPPVGQNPFAVQAPARRNPFEGIY